MYIKTLGKCNTCSGVVSLIKSLSYAYMVSVGGAFVMSFGIVDCTTLWFTSCTLIFSRTLDSRSFSLAPLGISDYWF